MEVLEEEELASLQRLRITRAYTEGSGWVGHAGLSRTGWPSQQVASLCNFKLCEMQRVDRHQEDFEKRRNAELLEALLQSAPDLSSKKPTWPGAADGSGREAPCRRSPTACGAAGCWCASGLVGCLVVCSSQSTFPGFNVRRGIGSHGRSVGVKNEPAVRKQDCSTQLAKRKSTGSMLVWRLGLQLHLHFVKDCWMCAGCQARAGHLHHAEGKALSRGMSLSYLVQPSCPPTSMQTCALCLVRSAACVAFQRR